LGGLGDGAGHGDHAVGGHDPRRGLLGGRLLGPLRLRDERGGPDGSREGDGPEEPGRPGEPSKARSGHAASPFLLRGLTHNETWMDYNTKGAGAVRENGASGAGPARRRDGIIGTA